MIDVLPGVLQKDLAVIRQKVEVVSSLVTWIHIDVADHTLVPNETFTNFSEWKNFPPHVSFEAHLMVAHPEKYIRPMVACGFKRLIAHLECEDPRLFLDTAKYEEVEVGLSVDGPSPIEDVEPFVEELDAVLIMGIEAGFSGQSFQPETVEKIKALLHSYPQTVIEVDGGINNITGKLVVDAGAKRLVSTSYIFQHESLDGMSQAIQSLREL